MRPEIACRSKTDPRPTWVSPPADRSLASTQDREGVAVLTNQFDVNVGVAGFHRIHASRTGTLPNSRGCAPQLGAIAPRQVLPIQFRTIAED